MWHALDVDEPVGTTPVAAGLADDPSTQVVLVRTADGTLHATAPACPHMGQPLARAHLDGDVLECAHHHYRYRLDDGTCVGPGGPDGPLAGRLAVHEVREHPQGIEVRLIGTGRQSA